MSDTAQAQSMTDEEWEQSAQADDTVQAPDASSVDINDAGNSVVDAETGENGEIAADNSASNAVVAPKIDPVTGKRKRTVRPRGWLEEAVKRLTDAYVTGDFKMENEKHKLTPHRVARIVRDREGLDFIPSTGAVSAVFLRWQDMEFATFEQDPFAFVDYTDLAREKGLAGIKLTNSNAKRAERDAELAAQREAREAEKAAEREAKKAEREAKKAERAEQRAAEREAKKAERAAERSRKAEERKAEREAKRAEKAEAKRLAREEKAQAKLAEAEAKAAEAPETEPETQVDEPPAEDTQTDTETAPDQENDNSVIQN